jgi:lipoprotein-anchoring transpeptidase ErfK/SrfK
MVRMFTPRVVWSVAAGTAFALIASHSGAASQAVDPGWQIVYAGQPGYDDGLVGSMFDERNGEVIVGRAYEPPAPIYSAGDPAAASDTGQRAPAPVAQTAPTAMPQRPQSRPPVTIVPARAGQGVIYRQVTVSGRQAVPQARVLAGQLRGSQSTAMNYRVATVPPVQADPQYTGSVPAQQVRTPEPATASYRMAAPQPQSPPQYAAPVQQGRGLFAPTYQVAAVPQAYPPPGQASQQPARQQLAFGYQTQPQQGYAYPAPAYAPSTYGDMAQQQQMDPRYERQVVDYGGSERPGTIIVDTPHFFLYLVLNGGKALRYGIGVGRPGFTWAGVKSISSKREWPDWRPPDEMLARRPDLPHFMPGGPDNPLGARALYLGSSLYRIHGSNEPWSIGTQVSSGCIRLRNDDIVDLYGRVKVGAKVIVI